VRDALDFQIERLVEFEALREHLRGFGEAALPLRHARIGLGDPGHILLPFVDVGEEEGQIPFIGVGNLGAGGYVCFFCHEPVAR
jgi:hypothetical protein